MKKDEAYCRVSGLGSAYFVSQKQTHFFLTGSIRPAGLASGCRSSSPVPGGGVTRKESPGEFPAFRGPQRRLCMILWQFRAFWKE